MAASTPGDSPLQGRLIAVTRAEQQLGEARRLFEQAGATVLGNANQLTTLVATLLRG